MTANRRTLDLLLPPLAGLLAISLCGSLTAGSAQQPAETPAAASAAKTIKVIDDIPYRSGASKAWRLDLALPENFGGERQPALVIVHGGGWRAGSKQDRPYRTLLLDYALKGYVTISVDYRLTTEAPFPACIEDVKCAVRWLRAHADQYHVDPDRIGAFGHSAGAHLVMMLALCPASAGQEGDGGWNEYSSRLNAVAAGATPTRVRGSGPDADKSSPVTYISSNAPPILLMQGTKDEIVTVESVDQFVEKLKQAGAQDVNYVRVEGGNHGTAYEHYLDTTMSAMNKFFDRTIGKK
jgi:acetyl esterase/lipase